VFNASLVRGLFYSSYCPTLTWYLDSHNILILHFAWYHISLSNKDLLCSQILLYHYNKDLLKILECFLLSPRSCCWDLTSTPIVLLQFNYMASTLNVLLEFNIMELCACYPTTPRKVSEFVCLFFESCNPLAIMKENQSMLIE